jgi:hypothetical protein
MPCHAVPCPDMLFSSQRHRETGEGEIHACKSGRKNVSPEPEVYNFEMNSIMISPSYGTPLRHPQLTSNPPTCALSKRTQSITHFKHQTGTSLTPFFVFSFSAAEQHLRKIHPRAPDPLPRRLNRGSKGLHSRCYRSINLANKKVKDEGTIPRWRI